MATSYFFTIKDISLTARLSIILLFPTVLQFAVTLYAPHCMENVPHVAQTSQVKMTTISADFHNMFDSIAFIEFW